MDNVRIFWLCYGNYTGKRDLYLFSRYVYSQIHKEFVEYAYKLYVTENLRLQGENKYLSQKFHEIINPPEEVDPKELVDNFIKKSGITLE